MITATIAELEKHEPCAESWEPAVKLLRAYKNGGDIAYTVADARAAGVPLSDTLWAIDHMNDGQFDRKIRLFLCDCAAHVLHVFEDRFPDDDRPRKCIEFSRENPGAAEAARAAEAAGAARAAGAAEAAGAARAARAAGAAEAAGAARAAGAAEAAGAAKAAKVAGVAGAAGAAWAAGAARAARAAEEEWQYERLELWFSDNEPENWPLPEKPK